MSTAESDPLERSSVAAFVRALSSLGWTVSQNVEFDFRWGAGDIAYMEANARELVGTRPDVILVKGGSLPAAQRATSTIPIVFVVLGDAIRDSGATLHLQNSGSVLCRDYVLSLREPQRSR